MQTALVIMHRRSLQENQRILPTPASGGNVPFLCHLPKWPSKTVIQMCFNGNHMALSNPWICQLKCVYSLLWSLFSFSCMSFGPQPHNELHMQGAVPVKEPIGSCRAPCGAGGPSSWETLELEMLDTKPLAAESIFICVLYSIGHVAGCFGSHYTTKLYIETTWAQWGSKQASLLNIESIEEQVPYTWGCSGWILKRWMQQHRKLLTDYLEKSNSAHYSLQHTTSLF